ncbi:uncharacterized protein [Physcomitrium patens]|uniref:Uncharacterized protein n=1 Tax=Physcomitrium patens TaxID=3218 RepID=A0A2K1KGV3_PHYPA|nr:uncharacterized protein LOC112283477 [Physcomitrium patens]PNR52989.1 hypothetical protein PHYPA_009364 [Physcomitrium patens]|eukprot:XP_024377936.1 uncharacterized protein LOC112283477 [Physcomitrella patens]
MAGSMATLSSSHSLASSSSLLPSPRSAPARRDAPTTVVVSAANPSERHGVSRRQAAVSLTALSVMVFSSSQKAQARDIPIFGLKKAKKAAEEVVAEVKELVKEGESGVAAVSGAISNAAVEFPGAALPNIPSFPSTEGGLSPALQAGAVAGAGVVGVLVASTVVNTLVSPSK